MNETYDKNYSDDILEGFIQTYKNRTTKRDYRREIIDFMIWTNKSYSDMDRDDCFKYIEWLKERSELPKSDPLKLSPATVEKKYSYLMRFFTFLEAQHGFQNHFYTIEKPLATREISSEKILSMVEIQRLVDVLKDGSLRNYAALMLAFSSGLWASEICNLRWNRFIEDDAGRIGIVFTLKDETKQFVKVHPDVWTLLMDLRQEMEFPADSTHVFLNHQNKPIGERGLRLILKKACETAKLPKNYTLRDLRHTGVTLAIKNGATPEEVQQQLRYLRTDYARRYMHKISELDKTPVDFLNMNFKR